MRKVGIFILAVLLFPSFASAAWVATDDFESYSVAALGTQSGGSGFSATAWTTSGTGANVVSSPAIGTRAVSRLAASGHNLRALSSSTQTGTMYFLVRRNSTSASNGARIQLSDAGAGAEYLFGFFGSAIRVFHNSGAADVCTSLSADTWYEIAVEYDTTVPQFRVKCRERLGTWGSFSSYYTPGGAGTGAIINLYIQGLGTDTTLTYFDRISDTEESSGGGAVVSTPRPLSFWWW